MIFDFVIQFKYWKYKKVYGKQSYKLLQFYAKLHSLKERQALMLIGADGASPPSAGENAPWYSSIL